METTVTTAIVAAVSAAAGGLITSVVGPVVKHYLEDRSKERERRRAQVQKWRDMILQIRTESEGYEDVSHLLQVHPDCISLLPHLSPTARHAVTSENQTIILGSALAAPLVTLLEEISRIEKEWRLR